jgi:3-hydroxyisobutyrate dehydrogenase-like beta-hydroxyacid dehydrogenase
MGSSLVLLGSLGTGNVVKLANQYGVGLRLVHYGILVNVTVS